MTVLQRVWSGSLRAKVRVAFQLQRNPTQTHKTTPDSETQSKRRSLLDVVAQEEDDDIEFNRWMGPLFCEICDSLPRKPVFDVDLFESFEVLYVSGDEDQLVNVGD